MKLRKSKIHFPEIRRLGTLILLLILISVLVAPSMLSAQTGDPLELSETYRLETDRGTLIVNYPEGWLAQGAGPNNIPYVALQNQPTDAPLSTMLAQIVVIQVTDLPIEFDHQADNLSQSYFEAFRAIRLEENRGAYGEVVTVQFGDGQMAYDGALMMLLETDSGPLLDADVKISIGLSAELDDTTLLIIEFQADDDIFASALPLWSAIIDTLIWNDVGLANSALRGAYASLEDVEALQQLYLEIQDQQGESSTNIQGVDRSNSYSLQAGEREIVVPRPIGWDENSREDNQRIRFESPDDPTTFFQLRWLADDTNLLSTPLAIVLQQITLLGDHEILDTNIFSLNDMRSVGVSYRLTNNQVGVRFGMMLPDEGGLLEITLQSAAPNWLSLQGLVFSLLSGMRIDDMPIDFPILIQVYQSLQNPSIPN